MDLEHNIHKPRLRIFNRNNRLSNQIATMVNTKRLLEMARKWQRMAALGKRRISWARTKSFPKSDASTTTVADKGHFIAYSVEGSRFMIPLKFLSSNIFVELLRLSEEVFGLPGDSPITLPCDAAFLENVIYLLKRRRRKDVERALLSSIYNGRCSSSSSNSLHHNQQLAVVGF